MIGSRFSLQALERTHPVRAVLLQAIMGAIAIGGPTAYFWLFGKADGYPSEWEVLISALVGFACFGLAGIVRVKRAAVSN
jgi:hypothetical protein